MKMIQTVLLGSTLLLAGSALAQDKAVAPKGMAEHNGFMVPTDEKAYLERLHYANQAEIKQGQLAQQNSMNEDVKSFAAEMVRQHTDADQKVMAYAQGKKMKLADMPKPMNDAEKKAMAADKAAMEKLQALKGTPFDGCYMSGQLGEHDAVLGKLAAGKQAMSGSPELTAMLDELTQSVSMHRQHAYGLLGKMGPSQGGAMGGTMGKTTPPAGGTMGGTTGGTMGGGTMGGGNMGKTPPPAGGTMGGTTGGNMGKTPAGAPTPTK